VIVELVTVEIFMQPGMALPLARKVTFPVTFKVAVIVWAVLKVAVELAFTSPEYAE
jgi:hypothetical protein